MEASVVILVFSLKDEQTLKKTIELKEYAQNKIHQDFQPKFILVGNGKQNERKVTKDYGLKFAKENKFNLYFECDVSDKEINKNRDQVKDILF